ncbi:MAG: hypothetical protein JWM95_4019 [Gemmatimonadetes bacterium]|nr:hypothetical protein [Gemmatimonadota bacterium]
MSADGGKYLRSVRVENGGDRTLRTTAEVRLEQEVRRIVVAMHGRNGKAINENFANMARGEVRPLRVLVRRLKELKAARAPDSYKKSKEMARALDRFVDELHGKAQTAQQDDNEAA